MAAYPLQKRSIPSSPFPTHSLNVQTPVTLQQAVQQLQVALTKDFEMRNIIATLTHSLNFCDKNLLPWLRALRDNAAAISKGDHHHLIEIIFQKFDWGRASNEQVSAYTDLLLNILSSRSSFSQLCFTYLVSNFKPRNKRDEKNQPILFQFDDESTERVSNNIHQALQSILSIVPSSSTTLFFSVMSHFPNYRRNAATKEFTTYLRNSLRITEYYPPLRERMLDMCVDKALQLDVAIKLEDTPEDEEGEVFNIEVEQSGSSMDDIANKLDGMMELLFEYLRISINEDSSNLWTTMLRIFEEKILPTQKSKYTQFMIFYLCGMDKKDCPNQFVDFLRKKIFDSRVHLLTRLSCTAYVGSFISRAAFIDIKLVRNVLNSLTLWCFSYINEQTGPRTIPDPDIHRLFYQICQTIFYIVCFHYKRLFQEEGFGIKYFHELYLEQIATCELNPLKFCATTVATEFGKICSLMGVISCCEIVESNKKLVVRTASQSIDLETFFPFDPYKLRISAKFIGGLYNEWNSEDQDAEEPEEHDDDSPSSSLGSDLQSMSLTPVKKWDMNFVL